MAKIDSIKHITDSRLGLSFTPLLAFISLALLTYTGSSATAHRR
ncbi:protein of unknown function [Moritella yayanosii]|uniref:Uncharacterized protein n=1 Tax=Moritella yayanosii TaxID=69539 RepID=A0A330LR99_9GAMM|nr:protein of unknown function [Moritella yayanosii]